MNAAHQILDELSAIGATVVRGERGIRLKAGDQPIPARLVERLREVKPTIMAVLDKEAACDQIERAAHVEYDAGIPREWAEGFAKLDPNNPPRGVKRDHWHALIDAIGRFLDEWAAKASASGWSAQDLFGADGLRPGIPWLNSGALWCNPDARVVDVNTESITVETRTGKCQRYFHRPELRLRKLPWDMV